MCWFDALIKPKNSTKSNLSFALAKSLKALSLSNKFCHRNTIHMLRIWFSYPSHISQYCFLSVEPNREWFDAISWKYNQSNSLDRDKLIQLQFKINSTKIKLNWKLTLDDSLISLILHCLKLCSKNSSVEV